MVPYDPYIAYQFLQTALRKQRGKLDWLRQYLQEHRNSTRGGGIADDWESRLLIDSHLNESWFGEIREYVFRAQEVIDDARQLLASNGLGYVAELASPAWYPSTVVAVLRNQLRNVLTDAGVPYFEYAPLEISGYPVNPDAQHSVSEVVIAVEHRLRQALQLGPPEQEQWHYFLSSACAALVLVATTPLWHQPLWRNLINTFAGFAAHQIQLWRKISKRDRPGLTVGMFLAKEGESGEHPNTSQLIDGVQPLDHAYGDLNFPRLYRIIATAQARIVDLGRDVAFLRLALLRMASAEIESKQVLLPDVRDIMASVVEKKSLSHDAGYRALEKGLQGAQAMAEFEHVLKFVTRSWGIWP